MSWCGGKIFCRIYREKVYCRKGSHADETKPCDCRHACYYCEVAYCGTRTSGCPGPIAMDALKKTKE